MSINTYYKTVSAVMSYVESSIEAIVPSTFFGPKESPDAWPFCTIIPGQDNISPDSNESDQHMIDFQLVAGIENEDLQAGIQSIIELAGDIYDDLFHDHTFEGLADEVYPRRVDPRFGEGDTYTRHLVSLQFTVRKQLDRS